MNTKPPRVLVAGWEVVVGLEVHVQLATQSKLFSPARVAFGAAANLDVDVVDAGLPGVLPVLNDAAVDMAVALGLALHCAVQDKSVFARKHYTYPDLPKGFQITQAEHPICLGGAIPFDDDDTEASLPLVRIHLEEDAGKSIHDLDPKHTLLDFNRAGTPLVEVVSAPALRSAQAAAAAFRSLRQIAMALGVCDGNLQEGSMRADANVSVRRVGDPVLGTRAEIKNINSPRFLEAAIEYEARRQITLLLSGGRVVQETRLYDAAAGTTRSMRSKEDLADYRYLPEPDLPTLVVDDARRARVRDRFSALAELPRQKAARYVSLGLSKSDAAVLCQDPATARFFEAALAVHDNPKGIANWVVNDVLRAAKAVARADERADEDEDDGDTVVDSDTPALSRLKFSAEDVGALVALLDAGVISGKSAKDVFTAMEAGEGAPAAIVDVRGLRVVKDTAALAEAVAAVLAAFPSEVQGYKDGKTKLLGFLVGQTMKKLQKADPKDVNQALLTALTADT
jgi:aspartyl-tRNA(Asn)/glutamyl-tRNA(Gln) amidotransferase subunit B